jgi:hypothetical protein
MAILLIAVVTSHIISRKGGRFAVPGTMAPFRTPPAYENAAS